MRWFKQTQRDGRILLRARVEGEAGTIGDCMIDVEPGGTLGTWSYNEISVLPNGEVELIDGKKPRAL